MFRFKSHQVEEAHDSRLVSLLKHKEDRFEELEPMVKEAPRKEGEEQQ